MKTILACAHRVWLYALALFLCIASFSIWNWRFATELQNFTKLGVAPTYRHELCILTRVKDVSYLLPQWIEYHTNTGVDHVYIANDCSSDNDKTMFWAKFYAKHDLVTLYESQDFNNCTQHVPNESVLFDFLFQKVKHTCEWLTVIDADEYMVPSNAQQIASFSKNTARTRRPPLKQVIDALNQQSQPVVRMPWYILSTHGHETRPYGFITNAYTSGQYAPIRKTLVKSQYVAHWIDSHVPQKYVWNLPKVQGRTFKNYVRSFAVTDDEFSMQNVHVSGSGAECTEHQQRRYLRDRNMSNSSYSNQNAQLHPRNSSTFAHTTSQHNPNHVHAHQPESTNSSVQHCTRTIECKLPKSPLSVYHYQALSWQDYQSIRASRVFDSTGIRNGWSTNARALWLTFNYTYDVCSERNRDYLRWANQKMVDSVMAKITKFAELRRNFDSSTLNETRCSESTKINACASNASIAHNATQYYTQFLNGDILL